MTAAALTAARIPGYAEPQPALAAWTEHLAACRSCGDQAPCLRCEYDDNGDHACGCAQGGGPGARLRAAMLTEQRARPLMCGCADSDSAWIGRGLSARFVCTCAGSTASQRGLRWQPIGCDFEVS